jgi:hypothetical protein
VPTPPAQPSSSPPNVSADIAAYNNELEEDDFASFDTDGDGFVGARENDTQSAIRTIRFNQMDTNRDERVSRREFETWVQRKQESREMDASP